jgi:Subtilase family
MAHLRYATLLAIALSVIEIRSGWSQEPPKDGKTSSFRIEFLGKDPATDWAAVVSKLLAAGVVPTDTLTLEKGQNPCGAILAKLRFKEFGLGCPDQLTVIIGQLNPSLPSPAPVGQTVRYPNLPLEQMKWSAEFDSIVPGDKDRLDRVNNLWKNFKITEKTFGTQRNLQFNGVSSELNIPANRENYELVESIEHYNKDLDRYDTRAVVQEPDSEPKRHFGFGTPVDWAEGCIEQPMPTSAAPPYISLLNGSANPKCSNACTEPGNPNCPEIVLIDQQVAPHPDLARALRRTNSQEHVTWCPFGHYDETRSHGTHLAGLMVSSGKATGFRGIAPDVALDSENINDSAIKNLIDNKSSSSSQKIYVYAGQFNNNYTIIDQQTRRSKPPQVEDMLKSPGLWVVAAGQDPALDIGRLTAHSPMNLGDQSSVIVVTSCDGCYTPNAQVSPWASYSSDGLVTVAAPGGSADRKIPATISASEYGISYGTSQATALVAGMAAAMTACYPQRYANSSLLKQRIETLAKPAPPDMSKRVSAGVVDATLAFRDPDMQWIKLTNDTVKGAKSIRFCTEKVKFRQLLDDDGQEIGPISVKKLRGIYREQEDDGQVGWRVKYLVQPGGPIVTTALVGPVSDSPGSEPLPLFYLEGVAADLPQRPIRIKEVESLVIGLEGGTVPQDLKGCR